MKRALSPVRLVLDDSSKRSFMLFVVVSLKLGSAIQSNLISFKLIAMKRTAPYFAGAWALFLSSKYTHHCCTYIRQKIGTNFRSKHRDSVAELC